MGQIKYRRIILKASGEALAGPKGVGINPTVISHLVKEIKSIHNLGTEIGVVYDGGNMRRGEIGAKLGMERSQADYVGMFTAITNDLALQDGLEHAGVSTRVQTSIEVRQAAKPYIRREAVRHLEKGHVMIFGDGTGNPYFSTDTAAALQAAETNTDVVLVAKNGAGGAYSTDLKIDPSVTKYGELTQLDVISKNLKVADRTASSLSTNTDIPSAVFNVNTEGNIKKVIEGGNIDVVIRGGK